MSSQLTLQELRDIIKEYTYQGNNKPDFDPNIKLALFLINLLTLSFLGDIDSAVFDDIKGKMITIYDDIINFFKLIYDGSVGKLLDFYHELLSIIPNPRELNYGDDLTSPINNTRRALGMASSNRSAYFNNGSYNSSHTPLDYLSRDGRLYDDDLEMERGLALLH